MKFKSLVQIPVTMEFDAFSHNLARLGADCSRETRVFSVPSFLCLHLLRCMTNNVLLKCCANVTMEFEASSHDLACLGAEFLKGTGVHIFTASRHLTP